MVIVIGRYHTFKPRSSLHGEYYGHLVCAECGRLKSEHPMIRFEPRPKQAAQPQHQQRTKDTGVE